MSRDTTKQDDKKAQPMDPSIRENVVGKGKANHQRVCYAAQTLVAELLALFPETPVEYSNHDGRNTALDVTFDLSSLDESDRASLLALFTMFDFALDPRTAVVLYDSNEQALLVSFRRSARTQDSREPFGLAEAWTILTDGDDDIEWSQSW